MAIDSTQAVRRAGLVRLKDADDVAAIVGDRVYGQARVSDKDDDAAPLWPFVIWGSPTLLPLRAACLDGSEITVAVHGFAKHRMDGLSRVETAESYASRLGAAIAAALDGHRADIPSGTASFLWTGGRLLIDGAEADAFHTVQNFRVRCMTSRTV